MKKKIFIILGSLIGLFVLILIVAVATSNNETSVPINPPAIAPMPTSVSEPPKEIERKTFEPIIITGSESKTSSPFIVTTKEWIIDWSYQTDDPEYAIFSFFIYPRGETEAYIESVLFAENPSGSTYCYAGVGEYYIKVSTGNIKSWEIIIKPAN